MLYQYISSHLRAVLHGLGRIFRKPVGGSNSMVSTRREEEDPALDTSQSNEETVLST